MKHLLENMFHTGTANPNDKFSAQQMHEELVRCVQRGKLNENDIPSNLELLPFRIGLVASQGNGKKS